MKRRKFIQNASLSSLGVVAGANALACKESNEAKAIPAEEKPADGSVNGPIAIATWNVKNATQGAWDVLEGGGTALDAVEAGCRVEEANAEGQSVGIGGLPDRDGHVTLDACIMNSQGDYGAVVYLKDIKHPISVARKVMEDTPHVLLAGEGARQFALSEGFEAEDLLTEASRKAWEECSNPLFSRSPSGSPSGCML